MASHHAHLSCVLKLEPRCGACKGQALEVLGSLDGVYDVAIDAKSKTCRIFGEVDPNVCLKALARCGVHAELVSASLTHPRLSSPYGHMGAAYGPYGGPYGPYNHYGSHGQNYRGLYDYGGSYSYGDPYRSRYLQEGIWHDYPVTNALPDYSYNSNCYYDPASTSYIRSFGRGMDYTPYNSYDHGNSMCNIM